MSSIARRYAKAILAVADEGGTMEETGHELERLAAIAAAPEVARVLINPMLSDTQRRKLAELIATDLGLVPMTRNFVMLLADHKRLDQLGSISDRYNRLLDDRLGRVRASIVSAVELQASELKRLVTTFEKKTGKKVLAESLVDESLLGGVVVDIGGKVYDGSLRNQLRGMAESVAGGRSIL